MITPREVPLGGLRAMTVRRTLPARGRTTIGAWCFVDHYGPDIVADTGGMVVAPHPHIGLQTVSWLFEGEIEHRDSAGHHAMVRPGEVNLMTAGRGISHSEVSTPSTRVLHGAQLWVALPSGDLLIDPGFEHYAPAELERDGVRARVFLGSLFDSSSPVQTYTPLLGAEIVLAPGAEVELDLDQAFEHGVLVDHGDLHWSDLHAGGGETDAAATPADLLYIPAGSRRTRLSSRDGARILLLGGPPLGEPLVMWWNFVGRTDEEVRAARASWEALLAGQGDGRFRLPEGDPLDPIPAPTIPPLKLLPR